MIVMQGNTIIARMRAIEQNKDSQQRQRAIKSASDALKTLDNHLAIFLRLFEVMKRHLDKGQQNEICQEIERIYIDLNVRKEQFKYTPSDVGKTLKDSAQAVGKLIAEL